MSNLKPQLLMIHYGELTLKGKNRRYFINTLARNIKHALKSFTKLTYNVRYDHTYINLHGEDEAPILEIISEIAGIYAISPVIKVDADLELMVEAALNIAKAKNAKTFKVETKRSDKSYPYNSDYINRYLAGPILKNTDYKVDVHNPELLLKLIIKNDGAYFLGDQTKGVGGLPLGTGGKVLMLLSGGIDSAVACYELMRRGIEIEAIHFASPPYTSTGVIDKITDLLRVLNKFQPRIKLHIMHFTDLQLDIFEHAPEGYPITIMRRMFYRIATKLAKSKRIMALATGESLGQVSSQTLNSLNVINEVTTLPVIRPLIVFDKQKIINKAVDLGTYEISIRPFEDACTIFAPINPKTAPKLKVVRNSESKWDYESQIETILNTYKTLIIEVEDESIF